MGRTLLRRQLDLDAEDFREVISDMGHGPGIYSSLDLYTWYSGMAEERGVDPVSRKQFGSTLKALGLTPRVKVIDGKNTRCWLVSKRWTRPHEVSKRWTRPHETSH